MHLIDLQALKLTAEIFNMSLQHNTQASIPTGIVTLETPWDILILEADLAPTESIIGTAWDYTTNNVPRITVQFSSNITRNVRLAVLYKT